MSKSFAILIDDIEQELQDTANAIWSAAELGIQLEDAIREVSDYLPHVMKYIYTIESRTGEATATTADALVDSTETQFVSGDVGKVVYNTYDNTWARIDAYVSTSQLTLNKDIMADDEGYKIFNEDCHSNKQINIKDITDYAGSENHGVIEVEYPVGIRRNFTIEGDILTIDVDSVDDSKADTSKQATDTEVFVWVEARQRVSQLTDLAGAIDLAAGYAAGLKAIHVDSFAAAEIIAEDTLFTIAGVRGTYRVTADATLSGNEIDINIYPALLDAASEDDVVTVIGSTLTKELERIVVELTAAMAARSKAINYIGEVTVGGTNTGKEMESWGERKLGIVMGKLYSIRSNMVPKTKRVHPKD